MDGRNCGAHGASGKVEKAKSYRFAEFDETWLLVSGNRSELPGLISTFILPASVDAAKLDAGTGASLASSKYARAYLHLGLGKALYEWTSDTGWKTIIQPDDWSQPPGFDFWSIQKMMRGD